ncbi:hypothetical protein SLEP1_g26260 [Rubroshorea leprosula]|uniref:Uncharacterized protein n=1 Tax=Rubroshorea leprosula TaxID=152421 RepID=A0AAV5JRX6_9ROSI|nr:hypothetical protein SLEP1_g26260 [Rubroshorea leprosula]
MLKFYLRAIHIYLLSYLIVFPCPPFQEVKLRTGKNKGSDELEGCPSCKLNMDFRYKS